MKGPLLRLFFFMAVAYLPALISCTNPEHTGLNQQGKPIVFVPAPPYAYLVERLAGKSVELHTLVGEDDDPHIYSPTPKEIATLIRAKLYFTADLPFENALIQKLKQSRTGPKIIDLTQSLKHREIADENHGHRGQKADDPDGEFDPHVWLSPPLFEKQAELIAKELQKITDAPSSAAAIGSRAQQLIRELKSLDNELARQLAPMKGQSFYTYHGAFAHLARTYGLKQKAIEFFGRSPEPRRIVALVNQAKSDGVKLILVQPQFDQASAKALATAIGGRIVPINPMAKDVPGNLRRLVKSITEKQGEHRAHGPATRPGKLDLN